MPAPKLLYDYALSFVGTEYKWGGSNPISGVDCSGFAQIFRDAAGMDPIGDQSAQKLYEEDKANGIMSQKGLGAMVYYGQNDKSIIHVDIMMDEYMVIGAMGGGSKTLTLADADKSNAFIKIRKLGYRKDIVAIIMPKY